MAEKLIKVGSEDGYPTVGFDREKRLPYHLDGLGRKCYHECPPGFRWNADGSKLEPAPAEPEKPAA